MNLFWIVCAVLLLVALPFLVLPLWRVGNAADVQRDAANLDILRDQSQELDADFRNGLLAQDAYEQGKRELQARLLEEVKSGGPALRRQPRSSGTLAVLLALALPMFSVLLYQNLGNREALLPQKEVAASGEFSIIRSETQLQELENKLKQQPDDPNGWVVLARSYSELQRFADAVRAYEQLVRLVPDEAHIWASYADAYAMNNKQSLLGEPTRLLNKALELDAGNLMALALSGSAAMERGDYGVAIGHWTRLTELLPPDNSELPMIRSGIEQARSFLAAQQGGKGKPAKPSAGKSTEKAAAGAVSGRVTLSAALSDRVSPEDVVYVYAREAQGQQALLAVLRSRVKDLPLQFTLDDSMALQPQTRLSGSGQIVVAARIARSGDPIAKAGDLQGSAGVTRPGTGNLRIVIDSVVP